MQRYLISYEFAEGEDQEEEIEEQWKQISKLLSSDTDS